MEPLITLTPAITPSVALTRSQGSALHFVTLHGKSYWMCAPTATQLHQSLQAPHWEEIALQVQRLFHVQEESSKIADHPSLAQRAKEKLILPLDPQKAILYLKKEKSLLGKKEIKKELPLKEEEHAALRGRKAPTGLTAHDHLSELSCIFFKKLAPSYPAVKNKQKEQELKESLKKANPMIEALYTDSCDVSPRDALSFFIEELQKKHLDLQVTWDTKDLSRTARRNLFIDPSLKQAIYVTATQVYVFAPEGANKELLKKIKKAHPLKQLTCSKKSNHPADWKEIFLFIKTLSDKSSFSDFCKTLDDKDSLQQSLYNHAQATQAEIVNSLEKSQVL